MDEFLTEKKTGYSEDAEFCHCEIGLSFRVVISVELTLEVKNHGFIKKKKKERCMYWQRTLSSYAPNSQRTLSAGKRTLSAGKRTLSDGKIVMQT